MLRIKNSINGGCWAGWMIKKAGKKLPAFSVYTIWIDQ